jgi:hypothetical protein
MMNKTSKNWILISLIYFLGAVVLGVAMSAAHDYTLKGVHVHLNLLGWVSMALTGLIYQQFPHAAQSRWAVWHFWSYQLALPVMMGSLTAIFLGVTGLDVVIALSSTVVMVSVSLFVFNLFVFKKQVISVN